MKSLYTLFSIIGKIGSVHTFALYTFLKKYLKHGKSNRATEIAVVTGLVWVTEKLRR
jgi:hypothetical protein